MHGLAQLAYPPVASRFYALLVKLTELDVFNSPAVNEALFDFRRTDAFSDVFMLAGVED